MGIPLSVSLLDRLSHSGVETGFSEKLVFEGNESHCMGLVAFINESHFADMSSVRRNSVALFISGWR